MKANQLKVALYMAVSANGLIAREDDRTDWSPEEWQAFRAEVAKAEGIIIGRKTYEIMQSGEELSQLKETGVVVVSSALRGRKPPYANMSFAGSPQEALAIFQKKGAGTVLVAGGAMLNTSFIRYGLFDEIFLDIEPVIFGKGVPLLEPEDLECTLQLLSVRHLSENTVQLHYKVLAQ